MTAINGWYYLPTEHQLFLRHLGLEMKAILAQGTADEDRSKMALEQHKMDMCRRIDNEVE